MAFSEGVAISRRLLLSMLRHARRDAPNECVGLLAGTGNRVLALQPATNIAATPRTRYEADPKDIVRFIRGAEARKLEWVGSYHSHPRSRAWPSPTDIGLAVGDWYPTFFYVLVSLESDLHVQNLVSIERNGHAYVSLSKQARPVIQAFQITNAEAVKIPILIR